MGKMRGRNGGFALKPDMSKAYDKLKYKFISANLKEIGFIKIFTTLSCQGSQVHLFIFVILDGSPNRYFKPSQGIRK